MQGYNLPPVVKHPSPSNSAEPLKIGDEVQIVPEWQDPGDDKYRCFVIEAPENCTEVRIQTVIPSLIIQPTEWIEAAKLVVLSSDSSRPATTCPSNTEYENYTPTHPDLIPADEADASLRIDAAVLHALQECSKEMFLRGWWALCWLNPGLHPDDYEEWVDAGWKRFAAEAFRRFEAGEIDDTELYTAEASHNRIWKERKARNPAPPTDPPDRRVVVRTAGGIYISRDGQPTPNKDDAARYFLVADKVEEQIAKVLELHGETLIIEDDRV